MSAYVDSSEHVDMAASRAGRWHQVENWALTVALAAMAIVPIAELLLRTILHTGIFAAAAIVQHLGLVVGMLGGAVAARENRLIIISALTMVLRGRTRVAANIFANGMAVAVCVVLAVAGFAFVAAERSSGTTLAYGLPIWWIQALIPAGFILIGWRLLRRIATNISARIVCLIVGVSIAKLATAFSVMSPVMFAGSFAAIIVGATLGTPLFAVLAGAALLLFWHDGLPLASLAIDHYRTVVNPTLPAIPLFTLAGYLLAESAAPHRLVEVFDALFGRLRGGPTVVTVLACTFFTSFTGASGATVLALGGLVMPLLLASGYAQRPALGLVTAAGLPGTLLMPALPMILYAIVAGVDIKSMFLGGALPSLLMVSIIVIWGMWHQPPVTGPVGSFDLHRVRLALTAAKWELGVPLVAMLALGSGIATPVESAALTVLYVFFITVVVHGDLDFRRDVPRVMTECGLIVGGILLIMAVALGLTDYLVDAQIPDQMVVWVTNYVSTQQGFLIALNVFLLVAGCVIEIYPAIMILAPILTQLGNAYGIDPVHLGILFLANMELGYLTPLVGLNLFFASHRFNKPIAEIFRAVLPLFVALAVGVLIITHVPWLSLALPRLSH